MRGGGVRGASGRRSLACAQASTVWLGGEARKGCDLTIALWHWGRRLWGRRAHGGGVAGPRPMEHEAQPHKRDQHQLVENERKYHGKTPHTGGDMRAFYSLSRR